MLVALIVAVVSSVAVNVIFQNMSKKNETPKCKNCKCGRNEKGH